MRKIEILDCTLRDGGYVNNNHFGYQNIKNIITKLEKANIDIIECGYLLDDSEAYSKDVTEYRRIDELTEQSLIDIDSNHNYTLMLLGEKYKIENLPECHNEKNNIIRMSFHKHHLPRAIEYAKEIVKKGYRLFLQPTVIMNYKDEEIIAMLNAFNEITLEGVAIVDTFGQMVLEDIVKITKLFDQYLDPKIKLAFHAHNNLQMAFANAIAFINNTNEERAIVIDASLYGMGRGAGNLPTELLANYLNQTYQKNYNISSLLEACDTTIENIKRKKPWGYSLAYYLSARYACHPSYVLYLLNKKMLDSSDIDQVLQMISRDKTVEYDKDYIEELYLTYNQQNIDDSNSYKHLKKQIGDKKVVLIGPGKTLNRYYEKIQQYISEHNCFVITINNPNLLEHDAVFYSNKKRYYSMKNHQEEKMELLTSNITSERASNRYIFDYQSSLSRKKEISDSALLIFLSILENLNVKDVVLVGFDGYSTDEDNYCDDSISYMLDKNYIDNLNKVMKENIEEYQKKMNICSLTPSKNIKELII